MVIYKTTNIINNKIYIGQTCRKERIDEYFGSGVKISLALKKYGKESFKKEIIDTANSLDELNEKEIYWINFFESYKDSVGYNIELGGKNKVVAESTKLKISKAKIGEVKSASMRAKNSKNKMGNKYWVGRKHKESSKKLFSEIAKNRTQIQCPHCFKVCDNSNGRRWHFDYCKKAPINTRKFRVQKEANRKDLIPVVQLTFLGGEIASFVSIAQAVRVTKIDSKSIRLCALGEYKQAGGFLWKFKN